MAIELPANPTEADLEAAMKQYDDDFGYDPDEGIDNTFGGMPAREVDKQVHAMMHGTIRPSEEDFLHVAEIHFEGELPEGELLRNYSEEGEGGEILREYGPEDVEAERRAAMTEEEREAQSAEWKQKWDRDTEERERDPEEFERKSRMEHWQQIQADMTENKKTLENPVQLEYIAAGPELQRMDDDQNRLYEELSLIRNGPNYDRRPEDRIAAEQQRVKEIEEAIAQNDEAQASWIRSQAKVITNPVVTSYGEDACGLILIRN